MNGSRDSVSALLHGLKAGIDEVKMAEVAVCPPYVYLAQVADALRGTVIAWGGQDVCDQEAGAFTGEISAPMLRDFACRYTIVGHSERRTLYQESDDCTARKYVAAQKAGLIPILCVGELLEEREAGITEQVVARQLDAVIHAAGVGSLDDAVIAYEPVWAIGTGKTATPEQAQEVHAFIRGKIAALDATIGAKVRILYGGSVKGTNAVELFNMADIDGGLIGGASLQADEFLAICRAPDAS
jgi:triosephosphate isomerase